MPSRTIVAFTAQISAGTLPAPTDDIVYMVHFPSGKTITSHDGSQSCVAFCSYHDTFKIGSQDVYYAALPDLTTGGCSTRCGTASTTFQNQTMVASHELIESITDPEVGLGSLTNPGPPLAWFDGSDEMEIADLCVGELATFVGGDSNTYTIQKEFSNLLNTCVPTRIVDGPPVPTPTPAFDEKVDLNGDGKADVCGRAPDGIYCALSTGTGFGPLTRWAATFTDPGFDTPDHYTTIHFPDLNGDGKADICGRASDGVYCALSTGTSFGPVTLWATTFSDFNGWNLPAYYSTIRFPDVNGDGKADVCARGVGGVYCALSNGTTFGAVVPWASTFSDTNGWNAPDSYSTIQFPDLNGDGKADVCGRTVGGVYCALSTGASFGSVTTWSATFNDVNGWTAPQFYSTIRFPDVNGDGKADICGRGGTGISCALSTGSTFGAVGLWASLFSDANGWNSVQYYSTIQFADIDGDHRADVCGRGGGGMYCGSSNGTSFGSVTSWTTNFSDAAGWNSSPSYYSTVRLMDVTGDGRADVCGRSPTGIVCVASGGTSFGTLSTWTSSFSDAAGWNLDPGYYLTIRFP
jgi:hypothetical protein